MSTDNASQINQESAAHERTKQLLKREGLKSMNPSYLLYREVVKHIYAYEVISRLDRQESQFTYINGLASLVLRANHPTNTDRLTSIGEKNPGGIEGETLTLLQSLGVLDDIPTNTDVILSSKHDPENKFERLRNFPKREQQKLEQEVVKKLESLSTLMILRDVATGKSDNFIYNERISSCGSYAQIMLEHLQELGYLSIKDVSAKPELYGHHYILDKILIDPEHARTEFFRTMHSHPDIYLPPNISLIPTPHAK